VGLVRRRLGGTGATGRRAGRCRPGASTASVVIPEGAAGEFLGFTSSELDGIVPSALLERLVAASPPAGETYTIEEV
jgi:hypothetical protein